MATKSRGQWASNIGFILAAAGSAVGLGNIWKFPGKVGAGGGGAFMLVYFCIVFIMGFTVMLAEFAVGRHTRQNAVGAYRSIDRRWGFVGILGVLAGFIVLSYYSVVGGWVMKYVWVYLTGGNLGGDAGAFYQQFVSNPVEPLIWHVAFLAITVLIVIQGVSHGIERVSKILMPGLFVLLIVLMVRSVTLPNAKAGLEFLLKPDFSTLTPEILLTALGQAFFSLSLGMGVMCTYGSYLNRRENLVKNTLTICCLDTLVAFISAFAIIPPVFAANGSVGQGGSFAFTALPGVFDAMPAGKLFGALFYVLLFFAALTSGISILEGTVAYAVEELHMGRKKAAVIAAALMVAIGSLYSLSQGALPLKGFWYTLKTGWSFPPLGQSLELLTDNLLIPLGSLCSCIVVGWIWGSKHAVSEIRSTENGSPLYRFSMAPLWSALIRYVAPAAIIAIFLIGFSGYISF